MLYGTVKLPHGASLLLITVGQPTSQPRAFVCKYEHVAPAWLIVTLGKGREREHFCLFVLSCFVLGGHVSAVL